MVKEEIFESSLEPEMIRRMKVSYSNLARSQNVVLSEDKVSGILQGIIDIQVHANPDAYAKYILDDVELVESAHESGMGGVVIKCDSAPSAARTDLTMHALRMRTANNIRNDFFVQGGIVLNGCMGGYNPIAVENCFKFGGRFVWTPSFDSSYYRQIIGQEGGVKTFDNDGHVLSEVREVLDIINKRDMVFVISHLSLRDKFALIDEARGLGVKRILVAHPQLAVDKASVGEMKVMVEKGAYIGLFWQSIVPNLTNYLATFAEIPEMIETLGVENLIGGTNVGQIENPLPVETYRMLIKTLLLFGFNESQVVDICKENARKLIGLS